jgi:hypothetical protein
MRSGLVPERECAATFDLPCLSETGRNQPCLSPDVAVPPSWRKLVRTLMGGCPVIGDGGEAKLGTSEDVVLDCFRL